MDDDRILIVDPKEDLSILKGLASEIRTEILVSLHDRPQNINELAANLDMPQSTVATNIAILERAGLVRTENAKGKKGVQKICYPVYSEIVVQFHHPEGSPKDDKVIEVDMPIGLYTRYEVSAPCGLCSRESIIGYLDVPGSFLDPGRMKAGLIWFETGQVEYKFPNNSLYRDQRVSAIESPCGSAE